MDSDPDLVLQRPAQAQQLILLLHEADSGPVALTALGQAYAQAFPLALVVALAARAQRWFFSAASTQARSSADDFEPSAESVAVALPAFVARVQAWQMQCGVEPQGTALVGYGQGAVMALVTTLQTEPVAARVIAIAGRYARLPEQALHEHYSVHLLHGKADTVLSYRHTIEAALRLKSLGADFTAEVLPFIGHELHPELIALAVQTLQQHIPARLWLQPGEAEQTPDQSGAGRDNAEE